MDEVRILVAIVQWVASD